jgi:hypothetical protein
LRELHDSILAFLGQQDEFLIPKEAYQQLSQQESSTDESPETTNVQEEVSPEILSGEDRIPVQGIHYLLYVYHPNHVGFLNLVSSSEEASEVPSDGHEKPAKMDEMERLKRALEKCRVNFLKLSVIVLYFRSQRHSDPPTNPLPTVNQTVRQQTAMLKFTARVAWNVGARCSHFNPLAVFWDPFS